jgi:hypothetical protein
VEAEKEGERERKKERKRERKRRERETRERPLADYSPGQQAELLLIKRENAFLTNFKEIAKIKLRLLILTL